MKLALFVAICSIGMVVGMDTLGMGFPLPTGGKLVASAVGAQGSRSYMVVQNDGSSPFCRTPN